MLCLVSFVYSHKDHIMHIITLRARYSDTITLLKAQGLKGSALRGALAAHIAINTPRVSRGMAHNMVRFMAIH